MGVSMRKQAEGSISGGYKGNMCIKCLVILLVHVQQDNICAKVLLVIVATSAMGSASGESTRCLR